VLAALTSCAPRCAAPHARLVARRGRYIDRGKFPDAVLNGMVLDLFGLYKEVVTRGGFRSAAAPRVLLCRACLAR
jgi:hypothetical protein